MLFNCLILDQNKLASPNDVIQNSWFEHLTTQCNDLQLHRSGFLRIRTSLVKLQAMFCESIWGIDDNWYFVETNLRIRTPRKFSCNSFLFFFFFFFFQIQQPNLVYLFPCFVAYLTFPVIELSCMYLSALQCLGFQSFVLSMHYVIYIFSFFHFLKKISNICSWIIRALHLSLQVLIWIFKELTIVKV